MPGISRRTMLVGGAAAITCAAVPKQAKALAVVCANCSTISQQTMEYAQQVYGVGVQIKQYSTQLLEYRNQLLQYSNMLQNTIGLPMAIWNDVSNDIVQLKNIANIGSLLKGPSGGILGTLSKFDAATSQALSVGEMADRYTAWGQMAGQNIVSMQQAMGIAGNQMVNDAVLANAIQQQSESAVGQVQVLQAANQMASLNFSATQQMHATLISQAQAINAYNAGLASRQSLADQATVNFLSSPPVAMTGGKRY